MITGRQVRAARALLFWTQEMLAEKALVALTALKRLESERGLPVHEATRDQVRRALEAPASCSSNPIADAVCCSSTNHHARRFGRKGR